MPHAWTPEIVERIIGNWCALQCINTDLVRPRDTRHIDLWAWTADPSDIPKRVWLAFTHRASDQSSVVFVAEAPPEHWHQGATFEVFLHMPLLEDYSAVEGNLQEAVSNPGSITPIRRSYEWRYGLVDDAPPGSRSRYPARLQRPPRKPAGSGRDGTSNGVGRAVDRGERGERGARAVSGKQGRGARDGRGPLYADGGVRCPGLHREGLPLRCAAWPRRLPPRECSLVRGGRRRGDGAGQPRLQPPTLVDEDAIGPRC
ncbi:hypothetical protein C2845_PM01G46250 [Panicum miliaceum]|uniref:Uncharacterized protein n=1 Tax=Panicum miliaceum TaxID=4540 RepID=A0A3L6TVI4_PANMI|nr:hypothetical protein C2845_PM01G46250 [Panicum miliaceum]